MNDLTGNNSQQANAVENNLQQSWPSQKKIHEAWECFVESGKCSDESPRQTILTGWERSREQGINPMQDRAPTVYTREQIEALLHEEHLGQVGQQVLDKMASVVEGTGHVVVLADAAGRIIYSVGHQGVQDKLDRINFQPGGDWAESTVGPNGVGTPILLDRPEVILGSEHYCTGWKPWNCYGSPVHNPSNKSVLGCIDVTGPSDIVQTPGMALVVSIAQTIESELSLLHLQQREKLRQHYFQIQRRYPGDALILVDCWGHVQEMSYQVPDLLGIEHDKATGFDIKKVFPSLWLKVESALETKNNYEAEIAIRNYPYLTNCIVQPVFPGEEVSGAVVTIEKSKLYSTSEPMDSVSDSESTKKTGQLADANLDLQSMKDDLISTTLEKNNGNVSKTARQLGINRSTIYRRMNQNKK